MSNTQYIKKVIEPRIREWLSSQFEGKTFFQEKVKLLSGGYFEFDAVSADKHIVACFSSNRAKTKSGNENSGGVRKALNDIQCLKLLPKSVHKRYFVFTDVKFLELIKKRSIRFKPDCIEFVYCKLPRKFAEDLRRVLDECSDEQKSRDSTKGSKMENPPAHSQKHKWTKEEDIVVFYLARVYPNTNWKNDPLALRLVKEHSISMSSCNMRIGNFRYLLGQGRGLSHVAQFSRDVFTEFKTTTTDALYLKAVSCIHEKTHGQRGCS